MKIQNFMVLFVIIMLPVIIVTSYYMSLQIDTINMQTSYRSKLLDSTKEAIEAYEVNTVEWNSEFSAVSDSKRRDVKASINTFLTSFANNIGIGGANKEDILAYIPAVAYTLYDGYYIYSPADVKLTITDRDETVVFYKKELIENGTISATYNEDNEGKILYICEEGKTSNGTYNGEGNCNGKKFTLNPENAKSEYKHILKPFSAYSKQYEGEIDGETVDLVVNYTLDNYVKVYGKIQKITNDDGTEEYKYVSKEGYLIEFAKVNVNELVSNVTIEGLKYNGKEIKKERLSENIAYYSESEAKIIVEEDVPYIYTKDKLKVYVEQSSNRCFLLDDDNKKVYIDSLTTPLYKKVTLPMKIGSEYTYTEIYQDLSNGKWYRKYDNARNVVQSNLREVSEEDLNRYLGSGEHKLEDDYSAINYYIESYIFSTWLKGLDIKTQSGDLIFSCDTNNNPESEQSIFNQERREVIKQALISDLNQSITSYSSNSAGEYQLPVLSETDWDQILSNVSIVTFLQNIPIGIKYFNDYAIATSTKNKEFVDSNEIYLQNNNGTSDKYYHRPYCEKLTSNSIIGYRNIDYVAKSYEEGENTNYYYLHKDYVSLNAEQSCYYCMIQRELYKQITNKETQEVAYNTALARERYMARIAKLPAEVEPGYYINVFTEDGIDASFKIDSNEYIDREYAQVKIRKDDEGKTYYIQAIDRIFETEEEMQNRNEETIEVNGATIGSDSNPMLVNKEKPIKKKSTYVSNSKINVTIDKYDYSGINVTFKDCFDAEYGVSTLGNPNEVGNAVLGEATHISSELGNGYVNVKLKYEPNYTNPIDAAPIEVYANINNYNDLTIVTNLKDITGHIRLKFTNGDETYYSEHTYNVKNSNTTIYSRIDENINWYDENWMVEVLKVDNNTIGENGREKVKYYNIRDAQGLRGFADAVNEGAETEGRVFYLTNDINMQSQEMVPIATTEETGFNGTFYGKGNKITGLKTEPTDIKYTTQGGTEIKYKYFGLFGKISEKGTVCNINIDGATINLTQINRKSMNQNEHPNYKTGGIVGQNNGTIENCNVSNSTIKGTAYVGGIAGETNEILNGLIVKNTIVQTVGTYTYIQGTYKYGEQQLHNDNQIFVGGIVGYAKDKIENCKLQTEEEQITTIGKQDTDFMWKVKFNYIGDFSEDYSDYDYSKNYNIQCTNAIYIGGLVGYAEDKITGDVQATTIGTKNIGYDLEIMNFDDGEALENGKVSSSGYYAGGIVGYYTSTEEIRNENFTSVEISNIYGTNLRIKSNEDKMRGTDTSNYFTNGTGGFVGYNKQANITGLENNSKIETSDGDNVGGILGYNKGNIENCINKAEIKAGDVNEDDENTGGIIGYNEEGDIGNCKNYAEITGRSNVGGIVGKAKYSYIYLCENNKDAKITGFNSLIISDSELNYWGTGGIIGYNIESTVSKSYNKGEVKCNATGGGIAGADYNGTIKFCYNEGEINNKKTEERETNRIGGIVGNSGISTIIACYNLGNVTGGRGLSTEWTGAGGIAGRASSSKISNSYNTGVITGDYKWATTDLTHVNGGIVGDEEGIVNCQNNYYILNNAYSGCNGKNGDGYQGLTELEMIDKLKEFALNTALREEEKQIYNTANPFITNLGYEGYGILWWQLESITKTLKIYSENDTTNTLEKIPTVKVLAGGTEYNGLAGTPYLGEDGYYYCDINIYKGSNFDCKISTEGYFDKTIQIRDANENQEDVPLNKKDRYEIRVIPYDENNSNLKLVSDEVETSVEFIDGTSKSLSKENEYYSITVYEDIGNMTFRVDASKYNSFTSYGNGQGQYNEIASDENSYSSSHEPIIINIPISNITRTIAIQVNNSPINLNHFQIDIQVERNGNITNYSNYNSQTIDVPDGADVNIKATSKYATANNTTYYYYSSDGSRDGDKEITENVDNVVDDRTVNFEFTAIIYTQTFYPTSNGRTTSENANNSEIQVSSNNFNTNEFYQTDGNGNTIQNMASEAENTNNIGIYLKTNLKPNKTGTFNIPIYFEDITIPNGFGIENQEIYYTCACEFGKWVNKGKQLTIQMNTRNSNQELITSYANWGKHENGEYKAYDDNYTSVESNNKLVCTKQNIAGVVLTGGAYGDFYNKINFNNNNQQIVKQIDIQLTANADYAIYCIIDRLEYIIQFSI